MKHRKQVLHTMNNQNLLLTEYFTTFQGEGGSTGSPATFIRLYGCNLNCKFCDEQKQEIVKPISLTVNETYKLITKELKKLPLHNKLLVITGGEPFLQYEQLRELIKKINHEQPNTEIHIETNGSIQKHLTVDKCVVSPKWLEETELNKCVNYFINKYSCVEFKFVITLENINYLINYINHNPCIQNVYLQPETSNAPQITTEIIRKYPYIRKPFKISSQTHKFLKQK